MKINSNSLVIKIIFFGVMLVLLSLLIFSAIFLLSQRKELSKQILDKGRIFAEFSAPPIYNDYISFYTQASDANFLVFKKQLEERLAKNTDIIQVELVSVSGRIMFDSAELQTGRYNLDKVRMINDQAALNLLKNEESSYRELQVYDQAAAEILVPIKEVSGSHVLVMRYYLSYSSLNQKMLVLYRQVGLAFLIVFILVFLLSIPVYRSLTKPIIHLSALAKKISQGDLSVKANLSSGKDEIGVLAENFNAMVDELRLAKEKASDNNQKLEKELREKDELIEGLKQKNEEIKKSNKFAID